VSNFHAILRYLEIHSHFVMLNDEVWSYFLSLLFRKFGFSAAADHAAGVVSLIEKETEVSYSVSGFRFQPCRWPLRRPA
jgi:hypothetical protein